MMLKVFLKILREFKRKERKVFSQSSQRIFLENKKEKS